ncbi:MAG: penicillin-binding transpeptidase domain-containing protein [bacterium]
MLRRIFIKWRRKSARKYNCDIDPDELLLDSSNLSKMDVDQFEGRIEKPISPGSLWTLGIFFSLVLLTFWLRVGFFQVVEGTDYAERSAQNYLRNSFIFAERGVISDRTGKQLAWNVVDNDSPEFTKRSYLGLTGISSLLGYVKYPMKDKFGFYFSDELEGKDGVEKYYNNTLAGDKGEKIIEVNALGKIQTESTVRPAKNGQNLSLSIDAGLQAKFYDVMAEITNRVSFGGGSALMMDIKTGEIYSMVNFPEYSSQIMTDGSDNATISAYSKSKMKPFLDRAIFGLYAPGSIVKPFMSLAGLQEKVIDPNTSIYSSGQLVLPNPYDPSKPSIFKDWKAHGWVDMRQALAVSSDVYFYEIGGGFEGQKGLGIANLEKYAQLFGIGEKTGIDLPGEKSGVIPSPLWKIKNFKGEQWRIGDTYHTAIGQYGFQVTLMEMIRAVSAMANYGTLITPHYILGDTGKEQIVRKN